MSDEPVQPDAPAQDPVLEDPAPDLTKAQARAIAAADAAEAARNAIALTYNPAKGQVAGGIPCRDLTVDEATVWLGTPAAVAALCAYGGWTPTDALPKFLRPDAAAKE